VLTDTFAAEEVSPHKLLNRKDSASGFRTNTLDLCTSALAQAGAISLDEVVVHVHVHDEPTTWLFGFRKH
jgi:hypothetical protein